jgi:hypothetical protein
MVNWLYMYCLLPILCIVHHSDNSCSVTDYVHILCIVLILEMYLRYFDPVINNIVTSQ